MTGAMRGPLDQQPAEAGWWLASDGRWYPPESAPAYLAPPPAPAVPVVPVRTAGAWWLIAGAGAAIVGSFLPWATITAVFVGTINKSGVQGGDGWISIALAVPLLVFGVRAARSLGAVPVGWSIVLALVLGAFAVFEVSDASNKVSAANAAVNGYGHADVGFGLWLVIIGAVATLVGGFIANNAKPSDALPEQGTAGV